MVKTSFVKKFLPYVVVSLGVIYGILPIDLIPDVPIIGWIDDFGVMGATILIALILYFKNKNRVIKGEN